MIAHAAAMRALVQSMNKDIGSARANAIAFAARVLHPKRHEDWH
jgi:hypothetical protein